MRRRNNGEYAFQWHLTLNVEDGENPLDAGGRFLVKKLATDDPAADTLSVRVVEANYNARRAAVNVVLESERSWPLNLIDDRTMRTFPVRAEINLPVKDGYSACRRPLSARLAVPRILSPAPPPEPVSPPFPDPGQG
ncbi:hypothetical protein GGR26_001013 [Lewinella marina]|uniref:hypothetical protein n=1 Tax=Neolewinella marina TaxID=438751 RepID=UPI00142FD546|nr:hypothetical protein [Neolewinella marina]NJB85268.1 hypothetical protein [Neolewinella marina]